MNNIRVIEANYIEDYKIEFTFSDNTIRLIDLRNEIYGEVFEPLREIKTFKKFKLNHFTIEWENGADFAPEFLYNYDKELA